MKPTFNGKHRAKLCLLLLTASLPTGQAFGEDRLTEIDRVQVTRPSARVEWLFNMGVVTGRNEQGQLRRLGLIVNTLISPTPKVQGTVPTIDLTPDPAIQVMVQDLDLQVVYREHLEGDTVDPASFSVTNKGGTLRLTRANGRSGSLVSRLQASTPALSLDVQAISTKPAAYFGDGGWVINGSLGKALYVSRTGRQLDPDARSTIRIGTETIHLLEGEFWEDHQEIGPPSADLFLVEWRWFALHFPDQSEALIYRLSNRLTGSIYHELAQRVLPDGSIQNLPPVTIRESDPVNSRGYDVPTTWTLDIPGLAHLVLKHVIPAPWYEVRLGPLSDWALEGACHVQGESVWGIPTLAWAEYTSGKFIEIR